MTTSTSTHPTTTPPQQAIGTIKGRLVLQYPNPAELTSPRAFKPRFSFTSADGIEYPVMVKGRCFKHLTKDRAIDENLQIVVEGKFRVWPRTRPKMSFIINGFGTETEPDQFTIRGMVKAVLPSRVEGKATLVIWIPAATVKPFGIAITVPAEQVEGLEEGQRVEVEAKLYKHWLNADVVERLPAE